MPQNSMAYKNIDFTKYNFIAYQFKRQLSANYLYMLMKNDDFLHIFSCTYIYDATAGLPTLSASI